MRTRSEELDHIAPFGTSKDGTATAELLLWNGLLPMCSHVPNRGEQIVRYYGYYINVCRGKRQKGKTDTAIPNIIEADETSPAKSKA